MWIVVRFLTLPVPETRNFVELRNDLKAMKVQNWKKLAQDRNKWKWVLELAKTHVEL
jgi:hypothetical protein